MDWQTKEYMDERFNDLEEKIDLILNHLGLKEDEDETFDDLETESSENEDESKEIRI